METTLVTLLVAGMVILAVVIAARFERSSTTAQQPLQPHRSKETLEELVKASISFEYPRPYNPSDEDEAFDKTILKCISGSPVDKHLSTKIAGVSHLNEDGSSRQELLSQCRPGMQVELVRHPENDFDKNAVAVCLAGKQLGWLDARMAAEISRDLDKYHRDWLAVIKRITEPHDEYRYRGAVLFLARAGQPNSQNGKKRGRPRKKKASIPEQSS